MLGCLLKARGLRPESCLLSPLWPSREPSCGKTAVRGLQAPVPAASHAPPPQLFPFPRLPASGRPRVQPAGSPDPPVLRAEMGRGSRGRAGSVGPRGRGSGRGPRATRAPTEARRGGTRGGLTQPSRQGEPEKGQLAV